MVSEERLPRFFDPGDLLKSFPFEDCNLLKRFKQLPSEPDGDEIRKRLPENARSVFDEYGGSVEEKVAHLFTTDLVYKKVNQVLLDDDPDELDDWIWFVHALIHYIQTHPMASGGGMTKMITWHAAFAKPAQLTHIKQGDVFRIPRFISTTTDRDVALSFRKPSLYKFLIPVPCKNASDMEEVSAFPAEREILLRTHSKVRRVDHGENASYAVFELIP